MRRQANNAKELFFVIFGGLAVVDSIWEQDCRPTEAERRDCTLCGGFILS